MPQKLIPNRYKKKNMYQYKNLKNNSLGSISLPDRYKVQCVPVHLEKKMLPFFNLMARDLALVKK